MAVQIGYAVASAIRPSSLVLIVWGFSPLISRKRWCTTSWYPAQGAHHSHVRDSCCPPSSWCWRPTIPAAYSTRAETSDADLVQIVGGGAICSPTAISASDHLCSARFWDGRVRPVSLKHRADPRAPPIPGGRAPVNRPDRCGVGIKVALSGAGAFVCHHPVVIGVPSLKLTWTGAIFHPACALRPRFGDRVVT